MNFIQAIFKLLDRFMLLDDNKKVELKDKADSWYGRFVLGKPNNMYGADATTVVPPVVLDFLKKWGEEWYVQVGMCFAYIWMVSVVQDWMSPKEDETEKV